MRYILTLLFVLSFVVGFIPAHFLNEEILSIDDTSYIAHSMTFGIDFDFDYRNEIAKKFAANGNVPSHPYGLGVLSAPFVMLGGFFDYISGNEVLVDRREYYSSWSFFSILFSASFYFLLGIYFLLKTIFERYKFINQHYKIALLSLAAIFSSGILYYVLGRFTMSHAFEFGTISGLIYCVHKLQVELDNKATNFELLVVLFFIAFCSALVVMVRPTNISMLAVSLIFLNKTMPNIHAELKDKSPATDSLFLFFCTASNCAGLALVFIFNYYLYGYVWPSPDFLYNVDILNYKGLPTDFYSMVAVYIDRLPNLIIIFFSSEVGVFYTMPVIFWGLGYGIYSLFVNSLNWFNKILYFLGGFVVFGVPFAIVLLWQTTASDYNYRYLMCLIPISTLLMSEMILTCSNNSKLEKVILTFLVVCFSFSFLCFMFYKSDPLLFPSSQINVFGVLHGASLNDYVLDVTERIFYFKNWLAALGKGLPSILILPLLPEKIASGLLPQLIYENYYPRFRQTPLIIYFQIVLLASLWFCFFRLISQLIRSKTF